MSITNIDINVDYDYLQPSDANLLLGEPQVLVEQTGEAETVQEAKNYCKIDSFITEDDSYIQELITASRQQLEKYLNVSFVVKTLEVLLNNSIGGIKIPYGPVITIASITDSFGDDQTDNLQTLGIGDVSILAPVDNGLTVVYQAGYENLPFSLKHALLAQILYNYEHRGDENDGIVSISPIAKMRSKFFRKVNNDFFL